MKAIVDLQLAIENITCPEQSQCEEIVLQVLKILNINESKECTIRIVDLNESAVLNNQYRKKNAVTNVLSFPFESPLKMDIDLLGDLVICAPLVVSEARQQGKPESMHWTHLIVHGCLHLLGYDHLEQAEADDMEDLERIIFNKLGFTDPYQMIDPA